MRASVVGVPHDAEILPTRRRMFVGDVKLSLCVAVRHGQ